MSVLKLISRFVSSPLLGSIMLAMAVTACDSSSSDFTNIDVPNVNSGSTVTCTITNSTPSAASLKVSRVSGTLTQFNVGVSDATCNVAYKLNGVTLTTVGASATIDSATLAAGTNTLVATTGATSLTWTIVKNNAPTCVSPLPTAATTTLGIGAATTFSANGLDAEGDPLSYSWNINSIPLTSSNIVVSSTTTSSSGIFTADGSMIGSNTLSLVIDDGTDKTSCNWNINVNGACAIGSVTPSNSSGLRVANASATSTSFQANTTGCTNYAWTLNGTLIPSATASSVALLSSQMSPGLNILQVVATNGTSNDTKQWNIVKNSPPTCSSQTPAASGNNLGAGGTLTLTANGADANSDALTYTWKNNGSAIASSFLNVSNSSGSSVGTFTPDISLVGTNLISAVISDGYDSASCAWTVQVAPQCAIATAFPASTTYKISASPTSASTFVATANDPSCLVTWKLNGVTISGANAATLALPSLQFNDAPGTNTLQAVYSNSSSSITRSWTVNKNVPPTCATQTPAAAGSSLGAGANIGYTITAGNSDADVLTYTWKLNNTSVAQGVLNTTSSGNTANATFYATSAYVGANTITGLIDDGYDTASCTWNTTVNGNCAISTTTPSTIGSVRVANAGSTANSFSAVTSPGCANYTWTLNGNIVPSATASSYSTLSSSLTAGNNILAVSVTNGTSTDTKTWTVVKNTPPVCSSQVPASISTTAGVGASANFTANAADANSDPLTFSWTNNGLPVNSSFFTITGGATNSQAVFTPDATFVGSNNLIATINDGYDTTSCNWIVQVSPACTLVGSFPSTSTVKVANTGTTNNSFVATANDASCGVTWKLNGTAIAGQTSPTVLLNSSQFADAPGLNTVQAVYSNGSSSITRNWIVSKNQVPTCATQSPAATGSSLGAGATAIYSLTAGNPDSDTLSYAWKLNNTSVATTILNPSNSGNNAQSTFSPTLANVGANIITGTIDDGYDQAVCTWNMNVNGACSVTSTIPSAASAVRVANAGTTNSTFSATTSSACSNYTWTLNGAAISGATSSSYIVPSSSLSAGSNILAVSVTNGTSTDTKIWTVVKNTPPVCSTQTPAGASTVGVGASLTYIANGTDANSDPLTFSWSNNGSALNSTFFAVTNAASNSHAVFTPDATFVGANNLIANISDGYDSVNCTWPVQVVPQCALVGSFPSTSTLKVSALGTASNSFVASANDSSCTVVWKLNGTAISGQTAPTLLLNSSQFTDAPGTNTVQAVYSNSSSSITRTWNVTKNQVPTCSTQSPAATGTSLGAGANAVYSLTAGNPDSDTLAYVWKLNNTTVATSLLNPSSSGNTSSAGFYPTLANVGSNIITGTIDDGYDTASCTWNMTVNGACAVTGTTPSAASSVRVAAATGTNTTFAATTSPACGNYSWTLNGSPISGATASSYAVASSGLNSGSNLLAVSVTNGTSTDTKTWTVVKNSPPVCSTQTPAATGSSLGVGANLTFTANGTDSNSDSLSYTWTNNGTAVDPSFFTVTTTSGNSAAVFSPNSSFVGNNNLVANISDGYDTTSCNWAVQVIPQCSFVSSFPSTSTTKISAVGTASNSFVATANDASCTVVWKLNGTTISGQTAATLSVTSSQFSDAPATNTLQAVYSNSSSTVTRSWAVTKNQAPTCSTQSPAASGTSLGAGANTAYTLTAGNPDSDALTYTWKLNSAVVATSLLNPSGSANTSQATFYPTLANVGSNIITSTIDDGYDQAVCTWNMTVNGACAVTGTTPSAASSVRVANAASTNTTFSASTSPACGNYTWTLNGTPISGAVASSYVVPSSNLNAGSNQLAVSVTNGTSTDTKTWTVVKNTPPVCSTQTPAATGTSVGVSATQNFVANATDADADTLTFAWKNNGNAVNSSFFTVTGSGGTSQAAFVPDATFVGNNNLVATISDGYDSTSCTWAVQVIPQCALVGSFPSTTTLKVPAASATSNSFVATANDASCAVVWKLNGATISGQTSPTLLLTSSQFANAPSTNTVQAVYTNSSSSISRTWTVTKNQAPTCSTQTPAATGTSLGAGANTAYTLTAGNPDSDTLAYTWKLNDTVVGNSLLNPSSSGNTSQATFYPTLANVGSNIITGLIDDGYDTASCTWNMSVNGACAVTGTTPSAASSVRVANLASTNSTFTATTSPACGNYTWTLNGTPVSGATASSYIVPSSALSPGSNQLMVSVTNGTSTDTKTWTVVKNTPPVCSAQTPAATGSSVGVGASSTYTASGTDANSDALTFAWTNNGTAVNSSFFAVTNSAGGSQAVFTPDSTYVGNNNLVATLSDGYDTTSCTWATQVIPQCSIVSSFPSTATSKIAALGTANQSFVATANDASCAVTWKLNGAIISGQTAATLSTNSSQFLDAPATNTLQAVYANSSSTVTRSWTITKNQAPTCATQSPATTGSSVGAGANTTYSLTAGNPDSDNLIYTWKLNSSVVATSLLNPSSSANTAQSIFYPTLANVGSNIITGTIDDGYDQAVCTWTTTVNGACSVTSTTPSAASSVRVANSGATSTSFAATTSPACGTYSWTLNGSAISGATAASYAVLSSALNPGTNSLAVSVTNGTSTDTKTWTVVKNTPPVCSSQTPAATGTSVGVGGTQTYVANATDANSDPLTFSWTNNGTALDSTYFTVTNAAANTQVAFAPNSSFVGSNNLVATVSDGYDTTSCTWALQVVPQCAIAGSFPSTSTVKIPALASNSNSFVASANDASCSVIWKLNGTAISGQTTSTLALNSSSFTTGSTDTLQAVYSNGSSSITRSWSVTKNQAPTCASQTPAATGLTIGSTAIQAFSGTAGNPDSDTLTYAWQLNGATVATTLLNPSSSGNTSSATFYATASQIGANAVTMNVNDGYDTATCSWGVTVSPTCQISAATPTAGSTNRVAALGTTSTGFSTTTTGSCDTYVWSLNGTPISGATGSNYSVPSSSLNTGANTLSVVASNSTSSDTKSWTVSKNTPPVCSTQTPAVSGFSLASGQTQNFNVTATDANSDPVTVTWKDNNTAVNTSFFTVTNSTNASQAAFAPDSTYVGANKISAILNDGYDTVSCDWNMTVKPSCSIASSAPSTATYKVAFTGTTSQTYIATVNDSSCTPTWTLNGATLSGQTSSSVALTSSQLTAGPATNTLIATYTNGNSTATKTWTITRNQAPTCSSQTPAATGTTVGVGGNVTLAGVAGNPDTDSLSYNWTWNGSSVNTSQFTITNSGNNTQAVFAPTSTYVGNGTAAVQISDGYDTASCSWAIAVSNACSISSTAPSTSTYKIANAGTTSNAFVAIANDTSCTPTWTLNGSAIGTAGQYLQSIPSSAFNNGPTANTLTVVISNGTTSTTRSWAVTKNQVPVCAKTPSANPTPIPYTSTKQFTATLSDPDGDTLSGFSWTFNGSTSSSIFNPITNTATSSVTTLVPTFAQVGSGQTIGFSFTDGYDTQSCSWTMDILNPNTVAISACNPAGNPIVVYSTGVNATKTLSMVTTNASAFQWLKNGSTVSGATTAQYVTDSTSLSAGNYTFRGIASDSLGNTANCDYNVKINAPPVIATASPSTAQTWKMNVGSTLPFSVTATDANSDTLTYAWTLDGGVNSALPSGSATTTFNPNYTFSFVGTHIVSVTVSDGYETVSQNWTVEVNLFSQACDTMYNGPVTGTGATGGQICTLVGVPGIGNGAVPSADQTKVRLHPDYMIDDGAGNWYMADTLNHAVHFFNRSNASMSRFGKTIAAGTMVTLVGNGANGVSSDNIYNNQFKLDTVQGIAYDGTSQHLFIADYANHRISMTDSTGFTTTVLGITGGGANATAANTDGQVGTSAICNNPADVRVVAYGGRRWLYATCYGTNTIKSLDIDPASGTYLKAYTVVGATLTGATAAGNTDGTLGLAGTATVNGPWALSDDGLGNIYWTENSGFRLRMAATGGSAMTYFGGTTLLPASTTISAADFAAVLTTGSLAVVPAAVTGTITKVVISGPPAVVTSNCSAYRAQLQNAASTIQNAGTTATINLSSSSGGLFYSDSGCTATITNFNIGSTASEGSFYYKNTGATTSTLTAASTGYTSGTLAVTTAAAGTPTKFALIGPSSFDYTTCERFTVQAQNGTSVPSNLVAAKTVRMSHTSVGNFYTSSTCSGTPTYSFTMPISTSEMYIYYATTVLAPANQTVSLVGNTASNTIAPNTNVAIAAGSVTLRNPRGVALKMSGATVQGFFISAYDQHRTIFVNNTSGTSFTYGANAIPALSANTVMGTGTGGYNTDGIGNATRIFTGYGLAMSNDGNSLLVPDYDNYRVRQFDISTGSGQISTIIGAGRTRSGNLGDSPIDATSMYLNTPGEVAVDNTNRILYVSDSGNSRIRRVNLLTGYVDTAVGKGSGAAVVENEDPTNAFMTSPRGLTLMTSGTTNFLIYADQASNTAVNSNCQIRAWNLTSQFGSPAPSATTLYGVSVNPSKIATVAGDYTLGCEPWTTAPANTNGGPALNNKLYNPEGIGVDANGNMIIANYNDHCIVKMTPAGNSTPLIGTCGTAGTVDGNLSVATVRYPTGIVMDPNYAADGNFFFTDAIDLNPSRVRYVNFRTSSVTIGSSTVPAASAGNAIIQTIWTVAASGNSNGRIYGLAAFSTQVCYAGGTPGNGGNGTHNVTCYDRTSSLGSPSMRAGPNELSNPPIRGGAPIDNTQEGVAATSSLLDAPYGLAFDSGGNLYISERSNHIIRMVRRWW